MSYSLRRRILPLLLLSALVAAPFIGSAIAAPRNVTFNPDINLGGLADYQHEVSIAYNPADTSNLAVTIQDTTVLSSGRTTAACRAAFTMDEGSTWSLGAAVPLVQTPGSTNNGCTDASIVADEQGNFYMAYINFNIPPGSLDVFVAKSTDSGATFPTYASLGAQGDRPYIAVDNQPTSPFRGSLYVAWSDATLPVATGKIMLAYSRDHGVTWSAPVDVSKSSAAGAAFNGALPVVGPDGTVYVFWMSYGLSSSSDLSILVSKSQDGGVKWSNRDPVGGAHLPSPGYFSLKNADPDFGTSPSVGLRGNSWPAAAVAPDGTIFVAWTDFANGSCTSVGFQDWACSNADVRLSVSRNGGKVWTRPVKVSDDTGTTDQFYPWIATHPDGLLSLAWLDRRLDSNNIDANTFYSNTSDGIAFLPNVRVSSATSTVGTGIFLGDYIGLAAPAGKVFPVWGDFRIDSQRPHDYTAKGTLQP
jgi:hypothetical protein